MICSVIYGCSPALVTPISTATPTVTLSPTNTSLPTSTSAPTGTPIIPSATVPAPDKSLEFLNGVKVMHIDTFDKDLSKTEWHFDAGLQVNDGALQIFGKDWNGISPRQRYSEGDGVVLDFSYTKGAFFEVYISHGFWNMTTYKTFGIYFEKNLTRTNVWSGKNPLGGELLPGNLILKPDTAYSLMMAVIPNGEFLVIIWKSSESSSTIYYHEKLGENWSNLDWDFGIAIDSGTITIDNFREIQFDSAK